MVTGKKKSFLNFLSNISFLIGIILCLISVLLYANRYNPYRLHFNITQFPNKSAVQKTQLNLLPKKIVINSQNIDLPIVTKTIKDKTWQTSDKGVVYLKESPIPGDYGNSIFYGHNWTSLLANLVNVKPGESIDIYYEHDMHKKFIVENTALVSPNDVNILLPSKEPMLTIYTCAGLFDSKRFVVTARPQKI